MSRNHDNFGNSDASELLDGAPIPTHVQAKLKKQLGDFRSQWENNRPVISRRRRWWPIVSIPLAAAAAVVVMVLLWTGRGGGPLPDSNLAWAQVAQHLQAVKTFSAFKRMTMQEPNGDVSPAAESRLFFRAPDQGRVEEKNDLSTVTLTNPTGHPHTYVLGFNGRWKVDQEVFLAPSARAGDRDMIDFFTRLRDLNPKQVTRRGEENQADGQTLVRFEAAADFLGPGRPMGEMTIWVDPKTSLPVRCLMQFKIGIGSTQRITTTQLTELRFDSPLDEKLFAWPDFGSQPVQWNVSISAPPGGPWSQRRVAIVGPDGRQLIGIDDFTLRVLTPAYKHVRAAHLDLKPEAAKRLGEVCTASVGKELTVQVDDAPAQKLMIIGPITGLSLPLLERTEGLTTQTSPTPASQP